MKYVLLFFLAFISLFAQNVDAVLKIEKNVDQRTKVTIISASSMNAAFRKKANELFKADFRLSGHFLTDKNSSIKPFNSSVITLPNSKFILLYRLQRTPTNGASLDIKFFKDKRLILNKNYTVSKVEKAPFLIHKAVSEINDILHYPSIDWMNKFVVLARYIGRKQTEIMLADYTFTYQKVIIKGGLNLFPKWASSRQRELYYSNYDNDDNLRLFKLNIYTGQRKLITTSKGMLACSDVSKDGGKLLLTMAPNGQPDIYLFSGGSAKRLTTFSGIDVAGKFVDGEQNFVFVSNRMGYPNIFKKSITGSGAVEQIVFHGRNNGSCDAYENEIVYSSKESPKEYNLYLTTSNGSQTRPLTSGGINQFPRFSSDGKVLMYIKRLPGKNSIGFINISANISEVFPLNMDRIQAIDW